MIADAERGIESPECTLDRGARVHKTRGAEARRNFGERNLLGGEFAVAVVERGHCFLSPGVLGGAGGGASGGDRIGSATGAERGAEGGVTSGEAGPPLDDGSLSGPLMPQELNARKATQAAMAGIERRNMR